MAYCIASRCWDLIFCSKISRLDWARWRTTKFHRSLISLLKRDGRRETLFLRHPAQAQCGTPGDAGEEEGVSRMHDAAATNFVHVPCLSLLFWSDTAKATAA